jgi:hypothetical protein
MGSRMCGRLGLLAAVGVLGAWQAAPASASWKLTSTQTASVAYNQGITFDPARGRFFLVGVDSTTNSALYRTSSGLSLQAVNPTVIPPTKQGYNHVGDPSFDATNVSSTDTGTPRVLLSLECYYPSSGGNTCGSGAIGVVNPSTLGFLYYVRLWTGQIQKAMWDEVSPDGRWIWTSSGTHLLAYNAAAVNKTTADNQLAGVWGGIGAKDLGAVLPSGNVTGAAFYTDPASGAPRLLLALNRATTFQLVSYRTGTASDGSPVLLSATPSTELTVSQSFSNNEPEGLATTGIFNGSYPLGGILHWQMLPSAKLYSRILDYMPN